MSVQHGISTTILPTPTLAMRQVQAGLTVCIGAVPAWQIDGSGASAVGVLGPFYTLAEFKAACGWSTNFALYPGCEAADVFFNLYNVAPLVIINPLDPVAKGTAASGDQIAAVALVAGVHTITTPGALLSTLTVKSADGNTTYTLGSDYTAVYDDDYHIVITRIANGLISTATTQIKPGYKISAGNNDLAAADIVAAVPYVDAVFPTTRMLPGQLIAPGWSLGATVAAAMVAKMANYNALFGGIALTDISTALCDAYSEVAAWISTNSYTSDVQVNCWPKVSLGGVKYFLSTHLAALNCVLDSQHDDIPYNSPSNRALRIDGTVLADGTSVVIGPETFTAAEVPFVTAINFLEWTAWGNRTGAFSASTDPLTFIPNQRMARWMGNTLTQTMWPAVDRPINARLVDTLLDSANQWINGLVARGALTGGRAEFREDLNPAAQLSSGHLIISYYLGFESPARLIENQLQLDINYYAALA